MKKILNWILKGSIGTFRIAYFLLAVGIILAAAYILGGYQFLVKGALGSDMPFAFSIAAWVDKYFPRVPFWYPLAGGGVSITHSYPVFSFYLTSLLRRLTDLELIQAFRVLGFSSVPLMALGIYFFVATRFKNQTAALIASVFYLISPIAWTWIFDWGFYAEAVSHILVMPVIIFWDLFFSSFVITGASFGRSRPPRNPEKERALNGAGTSEVKSADTSEVGEPSSAKATEDRSAGGVVVPFKTCLYLALTVIFLSLATLAHFGTGLGLMGFLGFYLIGYTLRSKDRKQVFVRGLVALLLVGLLTAGATLSITAPFYRYIKITAQAGVSGGKSYEELKRAEFPLGHILGFRPPEAGSFAFAHRGIAFSVVVSAFAILGLLLSFQNARFLTLALFAVFALTLSVNADFVFWTARRIPWPLSATFNKRLALVLLRFILPTLGALGAIGIFKAPFFWIKNRPARFIKNLFASSAGLALVAFTLFQYGNFSSLNEFQYRFGAQGANLGLDLRNIWSETRTICYPNGECFDHEKDACSDEQERELFLERGIDYDKWCHSPLLAYFDPLAVQDWCFNERRSRAAPPPEVCDIQNLTQEKAAAFWNDCRSEEVSKYSLCNLRYKSVQEQLSPAGWPEFEIKTASRDPEGESARLEQILVSISDDPATFSNVAGLARVDFSLKKSRFAMIAPSYTLESNLSQLRSYAIRPVLNRRFWAQQVGVFYSDEAFYGRDSERVNELARWFGVSYTFLGGKDDRELFEEAGWEPFSGSEVYPVPRDATDVSPRYGVYKFPEENSLVDFSDQAAVLVIGQEKEQAYDHVFRLASFGVFPYGKALPIWGKGKIDSYSLEDLRAFDVLVLHGYDYSNRGRADRLLTEYVQGGGRVFIDTGWQYVSPDWETKKNKKTLEIIPFERLSWVAPEDSGEFVLESSEFSEGVDVSKFGPLVYHDQPWNISTGERSGLKEGAEVVLSVGDKPLIVAGQPSFAKASEGKVVWSGMNIFPHAKQGADIYYEEIKLLENLFSWLSDPGSDRRQFDVSYAREHPDTVEFTINEDVPDGGFLLWKEAYHPDWKAHLVTNEKLRPSNFQASSQKVSRVKIHRAGPSFTAIQLPQVNKGTKVVHQYQKPWFEKVFSALSLVTYLLLPLIILEGLLLKQKSLFLRLTNFLENKISFLLFGIWKKPTWLKKGEEEDY